MNPDSEFKPVFDTVELQRLMVASSVHVQEAFLHDPRITVQRDYIMQRLTLVLRGYIWADPPKSISVRYPRTWWDAFKLRWFPTWALEAYPADYEIEIMEAQTFYPNLPFTAPNTVSRLRLGVHRFHDQD